MRYPATRWQMTAHGQGSDVKRVEGTIEGLSDKDMPSLGDLVEVRFGKVIGNAYVVNLSGNWAGAWRADVVMTGAPIETLPRA